MKQNRPRICGAQAVTTGIGTDPAGFNRLPK